jgi:hypothetical protein
MAQRVDRRFNSMAHEDFERVNRSIQSVRVPETASIEWCEDFEFQCRFYSCHESRRPEVGNAKPGDDPSHRSASPSFKR